MGGVFLYKSGPFLNAGYIMYSISIFYLTYFTYLWGAYAPNVPPAYGPGNYKKWRRWMLVVTAFLSGPIVQVGWLGLRVGGNPAPSLHSSNEPAELLQ